MSANFATASERVSLPAPLASIFNSRCTSLSDILSTGVGFIALSGVAVLNGLVMIAFIPGGRVIGWG
jgi:Cu/Ag efflux pump CusA